MSFGLGLKAVRRLVQEQDALAWHHAKLSDKLFKGDTEKAVFAFVAAHLSKFQTLPQQETLLAKFPELSAIDCPEPAKYYLEKVTSRFGYDTINRANLTSQELLKANADNVGAAQKVLVAAINEITEQRYRHRILDFGKDGLTLVRQHYHNLLQSKTPPSAFGWPYMDESSGGALPGDVISIVGRPATGKSFKSLYIADHNWRSGRNVLFVSMEMNTLAVAQREAALYAHTNLTQLKTGGYSTNTYKLFLANAKGAEKEPAKLFIMDGNLAADVEDIYTLAMQLGVELVIVDGAYLLRHKNLRLDRYTRVAENVEAIKRYTTDLELPTFCSWQFNRAASQKKNGEKAGLEDIGYTDAIAQISSIVLALMQEEGIETMVHRTVDVMKGRNGETGQFKINWDFIKMDFTQVTDEQVTAEYDPAAV